MRDLTAVLPGDVAVIIGDQLMPADPKASEGAKGLGMLVAFLVAVYGGTNGAAAILTALNIAYEEKEKRRLVRFYLIAIGMTLIAGDRARYAARQLAAVAFLQNLLAETAPQAGGCAAGQGRRLRSSCRSRPRRLPRRSTASVPRVKTRGGNGSRPARFSRQ